MAVTKDKTFVNTAVSGLVIPVEHNLGGTPNLMITELVAGNEVYVSLLDARIAEVKTLDTNIIQVTFASAFEGFIDLHLVTADNPSLHQRVLDLEDRYLSLIPLIESKVSVDQWTQLNNLTQAQIASLQTQINDLSSQLNLLESDVEAL